MAIPWHRPLLPNVLLGAADAGRTVKVTETATDVRTDGSSQKATATASSVGPVSVWAARMAPRVDFIDGLPQASTTSAQERFSLSPPHANAADGPVTVTCSIDGGSFGTGCTGTAGYRTPTLGLGQHKFAVRASSAAGASTTTFSWTVAALPAPLTCTSCFHPPHLDATGIPMTWDWQLSNSRANLVFRNVDMLDIDGFNNTAADVSAIHSRAGRTLAHEVAICYISLGSWENFRRDANAWPAAAIGLTLAGYPNEHWVDVRQLSMLLPVIKSRLQQCATKGFDGVEVDNIDGWNNPTGLPLTQSDTQAWLAAIANQAHADHLFVLWKNDPLSAGFGVRYFDGALSEQCYSFAECTTAQENGFRGCNLATNKCGVQVFADAGKWVGEVEYPPLPGSGGVCTPSQACTGKTNFQTLCSTTWQVPPTGYGFAAWRADLNLDGLTYFPCWPG
jgi:hypothetical protein